MTLENFTPQSAQVLVFCLETTISYLEEQEVPCYAALVQPLLQMETKSS
jgi:hypothetical protein